MQQYALCRCTQNRRRILRALDLESLDMRILVQGSVDRFPRQRLTSVVVTLGSQRQELLRASAVASTAAMSARSRLA